MESHFSSIHLHGSSEPALQETAGTCPRKVCTTLCSAKEPLSLNGFPTGFTSASCHRTLPIQTRETSEQGVQRYSICPPKANVLPGLTRLLQLVESYCMDLLHARVASPPVWLTLCCTDMQLDPRLLRLCVLPWWALRCFFPSTVLQSQHSKSSLSLFFCSWSNYTSLGLQVPNNTDVVHHQPISSCFVTF